jgi:DNA-binding CsgD family transcriptional regulator
MSASQPLNSQETLNYLRSYTSTIEGLCQPLENYGIKFFTYTRLFEGKRALFLCNSNGWYQTKFEMDLFDKDGFITVPKIYKNEFTRSVFTGSPSNKIKLLGYMYDMDLWNSIDLYKNEDDYKEVFHFASSRDNPEIINFYINNMNLLENYAYYFREKVSKIMKEASKEIYINIRENAPPLLIEEKTTNVFNSAGSSSDHIHLDLNGKWVSFSPRQLQCLSLLYLGKTAKEIGQILELSFRTVEGYLDSIKIKLNCHTRKEVLDLLLTHNAERSLLLGISEIELNKHRLVTSLQKGVVKPASCVNET